MKYKILIVDDAPEIHAITKIALTDLRFEGHELEFLSAYSAAEGFTLIRDHPDAAVILLDVWMETPQAGLKLANRIRDDLGNHTTRIILRTGNANVAPERHVLLTYDINDYMEKTTLDVERLEGTLLTALRGFRDIMTIDRSRRALLAIMTASNEMLKLQDLKSCCDEVLGQLVRIALVLLPAAESRSQADDSGRSSPLGGFIAGYDQDDAGRGQLSQLSGTGRFADIAVGAKPPVSPELEANLLACVETGLCKIDDRVYIAPLLSEFGPDKVLYVEHTLPAASIETDLLDLFVHNAQLALENVHLSEALGEH